MKSLVLGLIIAAGLLGCQGQPPPAEEGSGLPPKILEGFTLGQLLEQPETARTVGDLAELRRQRWYAPFQFWSVADPDGAVVSLATCVEYETAAGNGLELVDSSHRNALMELAVMCHAARLLAKARPAQHSFVRTLALDPQLPALLPAGFAVVTSTSERSAMERSAQSWAEVASVRWEGRVGSTGARYRSGPAAQEVQLVGRGDVDGDGLEDLLLVSRDALDGGSWFGLRLFMVTRSAAQGELRVLEQWEPGQ